MGGEEERGESCAERRARARKGGLGWIGLSEYSTESTDINQCATTISIARGAVDAIYIPWYFA